MHTFNPLILLLGIYLKKFIRKFKMFTYRNIYCYIICRSKIRLTHKNKNIS